MGNEYSITTEDLQEAVNECLSLSDSRIEDMSKKAREAYLQGDRDFINNLNNFMRCVML